uniref:Immunoglobulin V-set domain-containing protein n=1 Tax=Naja naja TaxID=35670 RepID=A0A8C6XA20_NAJNA
SFVLLILWFVFNLFPLLADCYASFFFLPQMDAIVYECCLLKRDSVKYWCKEGSFRFCSRNRTIRTTGTEKEVKQNGMSIKDNHVRLEFNVVMENLTYNDAGTYLCGVERKYDTWHPVELIVLAGILLLNGLLQNMEQFLWMARQEKDPIAFLNWT